MRLAAAGGRRSLCRVDWFRVPLTCSSASACRSPWAVRPGTQTCVMPCGQGGACQQQMHSSPAQRAASMDVSASLWAPSGSVGGAPARRSSSFTAAGAHVPPIAHARTARDSGSCCRPELQRTCPDASAKLEDPRAIDLWSVGHSRSAVLTLLLDYSVCTQHGDLCRVLQHTAVQIRGHGS